MKSILLFVLMVSFLLFMSCGGDSEESILDCGGSDITVTVSSTTNASCQANGSVTVSSTGGSGNIEYSIDGTTFQDSRTFSVPAGTYTVTARDLNGCTAEVSATVGADDGTLTITAIASSESGCKTSDATIDVIAMNGTTPYRYKLDDGAFQSSNQFSGVDAGIHVVTVQDDAGCEVTMNEQVLTGVSLEMNVMDIITTNCAINSSCHGSGASGSRPELTTAAQIIDRSGSIRSRTQAGSMPPNGRPDLTQEEIDLIACWVDDGAKDN